MVQLTADLDRLLLLHMIGQLQQTSKIDYPSLAKQIDGGCTERAVQERFKIQRKLVPTVAIGSSTSHARSPRKNMGVRNIGEPAGSPTKKSKNASASQASRISADFEYNPASQLEVSD